MGNVLNMIQRIVWIRQARGVKAGARASTFGFAAHFGPVEQVIGPELRTVQGTSVRPRVSRAAAAVAPPLWLVSMKCCMPYHFLIRIQAASRE